jgi:hypothetical protein
MDLQHLIPTPESIPAPDWLFHILDVALFSLHLLLVNVILGGTLLLIVSGDSRKDSTMPVAAILGKRLPIFFAWTVTLGVAPLLFVQVIFGHLIYSSSVLMGAYWLAVIPLLVVAYYAAYVQASAANAVARRGAITLTGIILLYITFVYVSNMTMMVEPERWVSYFSNREGTITNVADPPFIPRYLHMVVGSVAIAGLALSVFWFLRKKVDPTLQSANIRKGLRIFGWVSLVQALVGIWFLLSLRKEHIQAFMGGEPVASAVLIIGILAGAGAVVSSLRGALRPALIQGGVTFLAMIVTRDQLRSLYLRGVFDTSSLTVQPQYTILTLFLVVLALGLTAVVWMLKAGFGKTGEEVTR